MPVDNIETLELLFNAATIGICFMGSKSDFHTFIFNSLPDELVCYSYKNEYSISTEHKIIFNAEIFEQEDLCRVLFSDGVKESENLDISLFMLNEILKHNIAKRLSSVSDALKKTFEAVEDECEDTQALDKDIDFEYV